MTTSSTDYIFIRMSRLHYAMKVYLTGKYTILTGNSATGKSSLARLVLYEEYRAEGSCNPYVVTNKEAFVALLESGRDFIYVLDERYAHFLTKEVCKLMNESSSRFLLIMRVVPKMLSIDYTDILTVKSIGKGSYESTRLYADYSVFKQSRSYIAEDTGSGFEYFKSKLVNVAPGDGVPNTAKRYANFECAIVDGAACGAYMPDLLKFSKLYAPVSFEYLCCKSLWKDFDIPEDWWKRFHSREVYCTNYLASNCSQFKFNYSKSSCPSYILKLNLIPEIKVGTKLQQYADNLFAGDVEEAFNSLKNEYNISSYEEAEDLLKYVTF